MIRFALLLLICSYASANETTRIDGKIVTTGMTTSEVLSRAGEPDAREDVQNKYGAVLGQRWEYHGKRMVTLWVRAGKVERIDVNSRIGWIGVDLDGTLAHYDGWNGGAIGEPIPAMVRRVEDWLAMGREVRVFTARVAATGKRKATGEADSQEFADEQRRLIQDWTQKHLGVRLPVTAVKDFACAELWDDRAIGVKLNEGEPKC